MLIKRSFAIAGHRTSVALEAEFWEALAAIAARRACTLPVLVAKIDAARDPARPLASSLRVAALLDGKCDDTAERISDPWKDEKDRDEREERLAS